MAKWPNVAEMAKNGQTALNVPRKKIEIKNSVENEEIFYHSDFT